MRLHHLIAVPALIAALASCGSEASGDDGIASADSGTSSSPTPSASASSAAPSDPQEQALKFAQCMRANGVDMKDPDPNQNGGLIKLDRSNPKFTAAFEKCRQYSPMGNGQRTFSPEQQQKMLDFAKCMREHGIPMKDPDPNNPGIMINKNQGINPDDPKFKAAMEACRQYMPQRPGSK